jgi:lipid II isoglutaminyl synthase (glutamine-hydrolysing)
MPSGQPARVPDYGTRLAAVRTVAAVNAGKAARYLSRRLGRGGGSTLPGRVATRIDPGLIVDLAGQLPNGCAVITGTNGKTTSTRILAGAARAAGLPVITNPEGSNLLSGVATALLARANAGGKMADPGAAIGIFEVDEGALPAAIELLQPRLVVITNLFRDQLDRYFEVDFIAQLWQRALHRLPSSATVVLNADDPQVAHLGDDLAAKAVYFGLDDRQWGRPGLEHAADSRRCPQCGQDLLYELSFYAHLGHYACQGCGWRRPDPRFAAWKVELQGLDGSQSQVTTPAGDRLIQLPLAGLYNACNGLAAAAAASCLGVEPDLVQAAAQSACGAFGRLERVSVGDREAVLVLVKNPSGFNEALRLVLSDSARRRLLFGLNDNGPDGRDVSWIWDVEFEQCRGHVASLMVCGQRSDDLALRLKYAGLGEVVEDFAAGDGSAEPADTGICPAFFAALDRTPPGQTLYVLASYTALWTLRRELVRLGHLSPFWQQAESERSMAAR